MSQIDYNYTQVIYSYYLNMLNARKGNEIVLLDQQQRQELEQLYTKKNVNHSIIKIVSYLLFHV